MNKKPIYKRPWFIPLLITILIILVAIIYIQIKANTYYYPSTLGAGWSTYQKVGYAWPTFMAELFGIPLIALIWIIFGLYMLWRKIYAKDAPPEKTTKINKSQRVVKKDNVMPLSVVLILASATLIACHIFTIIKLATMSGERLGPLMAVIMMMPLSALAVILHIISIVHFNKKTKTTKKLSKSEININTANYICIILLIILTLVGTIA